MKPVDVPKFMNALVSDLQTDAWDSDVKLVLDASTRVASAFDADAGHRCLRMLLGALIRTARADTAISVVTAFEPAAAEGGGDHGSLQLTITAAPTPRIPRWTRPTAASISESGSAARTISPRSLRAAM